MAKYVCVQSIIRYARAELSTLFYDYNICRSPTCPQCRERCDISFIKRLYFDFAPDEPTPSTSKAAVDRDVRNLELENVLRMEGETEDTIRQLFELIEDESMRTEEYTNQLGDFDAQNEEISKLKSLIDDSSEDYKSFIGTIDDLNGKIATLEEALQDERRRNLSLHANNHDLEVKLTEFAVKLQSIENTLTLAEQKREYAEQKANQSNWEKVQNENAIAVLNAGCEQKLSELMSLQVRFDANNRELKTLKKIVRDQKREEDLLLRKLHTLIGNFAHAKNFLTIQMIKQINGGKVFAKDGDSDAIAPFCGNISDWRFMIVPVLGTYPVDHNRSPT